MIYRASVVVDLRQGVLDPHGQATRDGLERLGFSGVQSVRIGKHIEIEVEADSEEAARAWVDRACQRLLVNPAVEEYRFHIESVGESGA